MVDAYQVANRFGQVGVEGDPFPHEEVLGLDHLTGVLHLPDALVQAEVFLPVRLDDVEGAALLHILRPDGGIVGRYLLPGLPQALLALIAVMGLLLGIVRHQKNIQLITAHRIDGLAQGAGTHHGGQDTVGKTDGSPVHGAEFKQRKAAYKAIIRPSTAKPAESFLPIVMVFMACPAYGSSSGIRRRRPFEARAR